MIVVMDDFFKELHNEMDNAPATKEAKRAEMEEIHYLVEQERMDLKTMTHEDMGDTDEHPNYVANTIRAVFSRDPDQKLSLREAITDVRNYRGARALQDEVNQPGMSDKSKLMLVGAAVLAALAIGTSVLLHMDNLRYERDRQYDLDDRASRFVQVPSQYEDETTEIAPIPNITLQPRQTEPNRIMEV